MIKIGTLVKAREILSLSLSLWLNTGIVNSNTRLHVFTFSVFNKVYSPSLTLTKVIEVKVKQMLSFRCFLNLYFYIISTKSVVKEQKFRVLPHHMTDRCYRKTSGKTKYPGFVDIYVLFNLLILYGIHLYVIFVLCSSTDRCALKKKKN